MSEPTLTKAELLELAAVWQENANQYRAKGDAYNGGKAAAALDCAEHLLWYIDARAKDR